MAMKRVSVYVMVMLLVFLLLAACGGNGNGGGESVQENDHGSGSAAAVEGAYIIANYYNEDGTFSALGLALDEVSSEKDAGIERRRRFRRGRPAVHGRGRNPHALVLYPILPCRSHPVVD